MDEERRPAAAPRADFHFVLPLVLLPLVSLPVGWLLVSRNWATLRDSNRVRRIWARRLVLLVGFDTMYGLVVALGLANGTLQRALQQRPAGDAPRIGILYEPAVQDAVQVRELTPGEPAERAEVKVGDRILSIDGQPLAGPSALQKHLRQWQGGPVKLQLERGAERLEVELTPAGKPITQGTTEPSAASVWWPWIFIGLLLGLVGAWGAAKRAPAALVAVGSVALTLLVHNLIALRTAVYFAKSDPGSRPFVLSLVLSSGAALVLAFGARALLAWRGALPEEGAARHELGVALRGLLYCYALGWRAGLLLFALLTLVGAHAPAAASPLQLMKDLEPRDLQLLLLAAVVLAPIGEELLFRGLLLPWMAGWAGKAPALIASSALFAMLHLPYGWGIAPIAVYGAVLGWVRLRSRSLGASILLHTAINGLSAAAVLALSR